jgi:hypothetical protein
MADEYGDTADDLTPGEYARRVEVYLCRKNDGHLIRIVGPAFEQVCRWATSGVPFKVACRGIDRYFERYHSKGPRRWPVRVEFCENDVLDVFDEWRRAVGVLAVPAAHGPADGEGETAGAPAHRTHSLPRHLERVALRLSSVLAGTALPESLRASLDAIQRDVDALVPTARALRGPARQAVVTRLADLEAVLSTAIGAALTGAERAELEAEASRELAAFRSRMSEPAYASARDALVLRLARECFGLPVIRLD